MPLPQEGDPHRAVAVAFRWVLAIALLYGGLSLFFFGAAIYQHLRTQGSAGYARLGVDIAIGVGMVLAVPALVYATLALFVRLAHRWAMIAAICILCLNLLPLLRGLIALVMFNDGAPLVPFLLVPGMLALLVACLLFVARGLSAVGQLRAAARSGFEPIAVGARPVIQVEALSVEHPAGDGASAQAAHGIDSFRGK